MAKRRGRPINGIVLFDKPLDISSNQALQRVKRLFQAAKAGHTGSLDPAASGLLPICFGQATRISGLLLDADKTYRVTGRLGTKTDSGDLEGEVIDVREVPVIDEARMEAVLAGFRGRVEQIPPMYSALKQDGKRLYELAREGKTVERKARTIDFHEITLAALTEESFTLRVHSSKGAYIRTLVEDIGEALNCGAVVTELRRTGLGPWSISHPGTRRANGPGGSMSSRSWPARAGSSLWIVLFFPLILRLARIRPWCWTRRASTRFAMVIRCLCPKRHKPGGFDCTHPTTSSWVWGKCWMTGEPRRDVCSRRCKGR